MKKNTILKVLSVVILLTFVLSAVLLTGCNGKLKEDVAKAQTDVAAAQTDINDAKSTLATLQSELATLKSTVEKSATLTALSEKADYLQGQIDALEETIADLQTRIADAETALAAQATTNTALQNKDAALEAQINGLRTDLNTVAASVEALANRVDELAASGFADFEAATDVLADYVENERGELVWNEHSYFAFEKKVEELDFSDYFPGDYEEYEFKCQALSIRLIRATSVAQVEAIFAELEAYQSSIPTIAERFETELLKLEGRETTEDEINGIISLAEDQLKDLNTLYEMLNGEVTEEQQVRFDNIQAARAALEAAEEAAVATANNAVEAGLFTYDDETETFAAVEVLYKPEVEQAIETIAQDYAEIVEEYFTDEDMLALYGVGPEVLTGYSLNAGQVDAFAHLTAAKEALDKIDLVTLPTVNANPLYSDKAGIDADIATIDEWAETWEIEKDSENYKLIVTASLTTREEEGYEQLTYTFIKAVETYAAAMDALYTEHVIGFVGVGDQTGNLTEEVAKEIATGAEKVLYRRVGVEIKNLLKKGSALNEAIQAVEGFNADLDKNFVTMMGLETEEKMGAIADIIARTIYLSQTKAAVDNVTAELEAKIVRNDDGEIVEVLVTFDDGANITTAWAAAIEEIFDVDDLRYWTYNDNQEKEIVEGVNYTNYQDMVEEFNGDLQILRDAYDDLTDKVQRIYDEVKYIVKAEDEAVKTLVNLQKILWANKKVSALEGVNTPNFVLIDADEPDGIITFQRFRGMLTARVLQLVALAENAELYEAAQYGPLNTAVENLSANNGYNLNRTEEYRTVLQTVVYWIEYNLNYNIDQFFGEHAPEVVEEPTMARPVAPTAPVEPTQPVEPMFDQVEPNPDDYPDGEQDEWYQEDLQAYNTAYAQYQDAYTQYMVDCEQFDYDQYAIDHAQWEEDYAQYQDDLAQYEEDRAAYEAAWEAYEEYVNARDEYIYSAMDEYLLDLLNAVKDHFQVTESTDAEGYLDGKDDRILGIGNYNYPVKGNYIFIEDFEAVIAAAEEYLETYAAAHDEWFGYTDEETEEYVPGILDDIAGLTDVDDIRIHDEIIPVVSARYAQYVETYYAGAIVDDQFDEPETYEEEEGLKAKQAELDRKIKAAAKSYEDILRRAYELMGYGRVPAEADVDTILAKVADLRAQIAFYRANYCDEADTDQCKFVGKPTDAQTGEYLTTAAIDAELVAYQAQAKAMIVKVVIDGVYYEEIDYLDYTYHIGDNEQDETTLKSIFCDSIDGKASINGVKSDYQLFTGLMIDPNLANVEDYPID